MQILRHYYRLLPISRGAPPPRVHAEIAISGKNAPERNTRERDM
ncbi:hypothetical protein O9993_01145 [Vibrio lentus]|nr:hypothetical protein [Vibrio lentus]